MQHASGRYHDGIAEDSSDDGSRTVLRAAASAASNQGRLTARAGLPYQDVRRKQRTKNSDYCRGIAGVTRNSGKERVANDLLPIRMRQDGGCHIDEKRQGKQGQSVRNLAIVAKNQDVPD